jgi:hypothetical protein
VAVFCTPEESMATVQRSQAAAILQKQTESYDCGSGWPVKPIPLG